MKPVSKAPGSTLLKLKHDGPLSICAFNFNLRSCTEVGAEASVNTIPAKFTELKDKFGKDWAGAMVGRCKLTLSNPSLNRLELRA